MRKFLKLEFKKSIMLAVILSVVCSIPHLLDVASMRFWVQYYDAYEILQRQITTPPLSSVGTMMIALCVVIPIYVYAFKMNKRSVDMYYSLPVKKEKLYFIKTMVGLFLIFVPFTVSYWSGFFVLLCRSGNPYAMGYYVPAYFGLLLFGVCIYGVNAFVYTRANSVVDGVIFLFAYMLLGDLLVDVVEATGGFYFDWWIESCFYSFGPASLFMDNMTEYIRHANSTHWPALMFIVPIVTGAIAYFLLFFNLRFDKAENAEQISNSWFGYKILIPTYVVACIAVIETDLLLTTMVGIAGFIGLLIYQRKFRFSWKYWVMLVVALIVGTVWSIIIW